jgi:hypothetical protein
MAVFRAGIIKLTHTHIRVRVRVMGSESMILENRFERRVFMVLLFYSVCQGLSLRKRELVFESIGRSNFLF